LAISNVLTQLPITLRTLTTANGYQTTVKTVFDVEKFPKDVDPTKCPALSYSWINAPRAEFDEANDTYSLFFAIMGVVTVATDVSETGALQLALAKLYEDVVNLFNSQTTSLAKLDEVEDITVIDGYPDSSGNKGWIYIPIKINYK
jgi:hypothetical protein